MTAERRPWIAAVFNLLLPGLGHLYVGRPGLALALSLSGFLLIGLLYVGALFVPLVPWNVAIPLLLSPVVLFGGSLHAALLARRIGPNYSPKPYNRWYVYAGLYLVLGLFLYPTLPPALRAHVIEAFRIPSGSMEPSARIGDFLYVAKWPREQRQPALGRMVVFESVEEPGLKSIKRVVGMPGDTVSMLAGGLIRNGRRAPEPYVIHVDSTRSEDPVQRAKMKQWQLPHLVSSQSDYAPDLQTWGPLVVPNDSFFALGDNRDASYDSRYFGFIPAGNVVGRPSVIYFSLEPRSPAPFLRRVRWPRIGQRLN
jgi:signal peptidase I